MKWLPLFLLLAALDASGRIVEEKRWIPARALDAKGHEVARQIMVTFIYDDAAKAPHPAMVLNHGRASTAAERQEMGRATYYEVSKWFAGLGFIVAIPTRIGYGVTGGPNLEDTGTCEKKVYPPGYDAALAQTLTVLEHLRGRKDVEKDRALIAGQSYGGTTAITLAAANTPGVQAAINFAGGGGGRPRTHPGNPCSQPQLKKLFADYGKTARLPTLWIYSENDEYFGPTLPKEWFEAFRAAGGKGEFVQYPPFGEKGHAMFTARPEMWKPRVLQFLRANGYPDLKEHP